MIAGMIMALNAPRANPIQRAINILTSSGPGAWYDPSDIANYTATGPELVTNGTFTANTSGWTPVLGGTITHSAGSAVFGSSGVSDLTVEQIITTKVGSAYRISVDVSAISAGAQGIMAGTVSGGTNLLLALSTAIGSRSATFTATTTTTYIGWICGDANRTATVDNISVKELTGLSACTMFQDSAGSVPVTAVEQPVGRILDKSGGGNHAIQPTATSRPTLSSRYNLLSKTEDFSAAAWTKLNVTATAGKVSETAVTGVFIAYQSVMPGAGTYTFTVEAKAAERSRIALEYASSTPFAVFDLSTGVVQSFGSSTATITSLGDGWYRCTMTATLAAGSTSAVGVRDNAGNRSYAGSAGSGVLVRVSSLVVSPDASLPYQRVNTATDYDYDSSKFPPFLRMDGIDDSMYTSAIDFTSTDKMCVFAGVHKASDSGVQTVVELSSGAVGNNGAFVYWLNGYSTGIDAAALSGTAVVYPTAALSAPATRVLSLVGDIASDTALIRHNGAQVGSSAGDQGAGNFGNYPLYIGRRNNASLPFSGRIYQLAIKGKSLSAGEVSTVESFVNSKTKAY